MSSWVHYERKIVLVIGGNCFFFFFESCHVLEETSSFINMVIIRATRFGVQRCWLVGLSMQCSPLSFCA